MQQSSSIKWKPLLLSLLISMGAGGLGGLLTGKSTQIYTSLHLPPLAPPGFVFPIAWMLLYFLMGISAYLIYCSKNPARRQVLTLYGIQLVVNLLWSPIFFRLEAFLFAFFWLCALWVLVLTMVISFRNIHKTAGLLQIPYLLWVTFAGYLNLGIYLLNR